MKKVYYSTSLFKAKGRGEIYNNHNEKILEFENDLTWTSKKDIINLICGQPLDVGTYPTAKLKSLNEISLICYYVSQMSKHSYELNQMFLWHLP